MSFVIISEPIRTGHKSYVVLIGTCDRVTANTFSSLEEANAELRAVKNIMAMGSGAVSMQLINDAGGLEKTRAAFMSSYNRMRSRRYIARALSRLRAWWKWLR